MQKGFTSIIIIATLFVAIGLGGIWFLYTQTKSLATERNDLQSKVADRDADISKLQNEKTKIEQELAVIKASDIAKNVELLRLKLNNTENDLTKVRGENVPREANMAKIKLYADAVAVIDQNLAPSPPTPLNSNLNGIDIKIGVLNDSQVSDLWRQAKSVFDAGGDGTGGPTGLIQTYFLVISKIRDLIP